jgi:capsular polysaccharide export protein
MATDACPATTLGQAGKRRFLLLQGPSSPFFARLADQLRVDGHHVVKVNFNAGDALYWGTRPSVACRAGREELKRFFEDIHRQHGITDQLLFGDCRPVHQPAIARARQAGIRTHVFEEAYFRPGWITLEREGVNANSPLPRDPGWFRAAGAAISTEDAPPVEFAAPFRVRAFHDVAYHVAGICNPVLYPGYRTHALVPAPVAYLGHLRRFALSPWWRRRDARIVRRLGSGQPQCFVLPLQLDSDAQIREHSRFSGMEEVIHLVMASFAAHAPRDIRLVVKSHPLDTGLRGHAATIANLAGSLGVLGRVDYLETGDLGEVLARARGVVTVNSTAGGVALGLGAAPESPLELLLRRFPASAPARAVMLRQGETS